MKLYILQAHGYNKVWLWWSYINGHTLSPNSTFDQKYIWHGLNGNTNMLQNYLNHSAVQLNTISCIDQWNGLMLVGCLKQLHNSYSGSWIIYCGSSDCSLSPLWGCSILNLPKKVKNSQFLFQSWDQLFSSLVLRGPTLTMMSLTCPAWILLDSSALNLEMCPSAQEPLERHPEDYCSFLVTWRSLEVTQALVGKQAGMQLNSPVISIP